MHWTCATCGAEHDDLPLDWAFDSPVFWDGPHGPNDKLSSDLCIWTDADERECYFIRGLIELPIHGLEQTFNYGVWSSLSERSFERVLELWDSVERTREPAYFGWLSNSISDFPETVGLPLDVLTSRLERRPTFHLHDAEHPLVDAQRDGVDLSWVQQMAERNLHGM